MTDRPITNNIFPLHDIKTLSSKFPTFDRSQLSISGYKYSTNHTYDNVIPCEDCKNHGIWTNYLINFHIVNIKLRFGFYVEANILIKDIVESIIKIY